jgi:hypothetical protein
MAWRLAIYTHRRKPNKKGDRLLKPIETLFAEINTVSNVQAKKLAIISLNTVTLIVSAMLMMIYPIRIL